MTLVTAGRLLWSAQRRLLLHGIFAADGLFITTASETPRLTIISPVYGGDRTMEGFLEDLVQQTCFDRRECLLLLPRSPASEWTFITSLYTEQVPRVVRGRRGVPAESVRGAG